MAQVKTKQYVPQTINNSSIFHLICLQMQRKVVKKNLAKMSYDALSSQPQTQIVACPQATQ